MRDTLGASAKFGLAKVITPLTIIGLVVFAVVIVVEYRILIGVATGFNLWCSRISFLVAIYACGKCH